jgi:3-phosphoshikimate 1-carboxyvinyltransferase
MKNFKIKPGKELHGTIEITPSKSHSLRAILFASLAEGTSTVRNYLLSPDAQAMIVACRALGAAIDIHDDKLIITGVAGKPKTPDNVIDCGNSGQVLRFVGALAALCDGYTVLTGDESIRTRRPAQPLLEGLNQLGALAKSSRNNGLAPLVIAGPPKAGKVTITDGKDSQPVSGMLMLAAFLDGETEIIVENAGEKPWIGLTLDWFNRLGIPCRHENFEHYWVQGNNQLKAFDYTVPGDFSSAAFPAVAALVSQSEITLHPIDMRDSQGDKLIFPALEKMGAQFEYDQAALTLKIFKNEKLTGCKIDINDFIDAITILGVVGCYAEGETVITGAAIAKEKECNRINAIATELKKVGADIEETADGLIIRKSKLTANKAGNSYHDHRMAMSLAVAALMTDDENVVEDTACVSKSFPGFAKAMQSIGMQIEEVESD